MNVRAICRWWSRTALNEPGPSAARSCRPCSPTMIARNASTASSSTPVQQRRPRHHPVHVQAVVGHQRQQPHEVAPRRPASDPVPVDEPRRALRRDEHVVRPQVAVHQPISDQCLRGQPAEPRQLARPPRQAAEVCRPARTARRSRARRGTLSAATSPPTSTASEASVSPATSAGSSRGQLDARRVRRIGVRAAVQGIPGTLPSMASRTISCQSPAAAAPDQLGCGHPTGQRAQDARLARNRLQRKGSRRPGSLGEHAATVAQRQQPGIRAGEACGHRREGDLDGRPGHAWRLPLHLRGRSVNAGRDDVWR